MHLCVNLFWLFYYYTLFMEHHNSSTGDPAKRNMRSVFGVLACYLLVGSGDFCVKRLH